MHCVEIYGHDGRRRWTTEMHWLDTLNGEGSNPCGVANRNKDFRKGGGFLGNVSEDKIVCRIFFM